jgi:hypothetical protein
MRLPLPVRALTYDSSRQPAGLRSALQRLWAYHWAGQTPEAHLARAHDRAALRAEYGGHLDLYPAPRGRPAPLAAQPGGDRP